MMRRMLRFLPIVAALALVAPSRADVWRVPADAETIGDALVFAEAGDSVVVACGTYLEHSLVAAQGVTLVSETGENCVTIDAQGSGRVLTIQAGTALPTRLAGLTFLNGAVEGNGGGVHAEEIADLTVIDCRFEANVATPESGGGLWLRNCDRAWVQRCHFVGNSAASGGALELANSHDVRIDQSVFHGNDALGSGGALTNYSNRLLVTDSTFELNTSGWAGGAILQHFGGSRFERSTFVKNEVEPYAKTSNAEGICGGTMGGAVYFGSYDLETTTFFRCTMYGNVSEHGVISGCIENVLIRESVVASNDAPAYVNFGYGTYRFFCSVIFGNAWDSTQAFNGGRNVFLDPCFCDAEAGDLRVTADSPCLPANRDDTCEITLGALGQGCEAAECNIVPTRRIRWSELKRRF